MRYASFGYDFVARRVPWAAIGGARATAPASARWATTGPAAKTPRSSIQPPGASAMANVVANRASGGEKMKLFSSQELL